MSEIIVKPLEWVVQAEIPNRRYEEHKAYTVFGTYAVFHRYNRAEWGLVGGNTGIVDAKTVDEAKAAAQADYESRILSAIDLEATKAEIAAKEEKRAEQWRMRREAEGSRDAARAAADSLRIERDALRIAISDVLEGWDFWEVNPHDREPPRGAIRLARAALNASEREA